MIRLLIAALAACIACGGGTPSSADGSTPGDAGTDASVAPDAGSDPLAVTFRPAAEPAAGPLAIWGAIIAPIDARRALLFGGTNANETSGGTLDATWSYDASSGALVAEEIVGAGPEARYCGCAAWDPARQRLVMTGGRNITAPLSVPPETWELDPATGAWAEIAVPATPGAVIGCMLAYSEAAGAMFLFGGAGEAGPSDTVYRYDPAAPEWVLLAATGPAPRYDGFFHPIGDGASLLLFGGSYGATGAAFYSDVWRFDTAAETWSEVIVDGATPPGRRVPWAVLDETSTGLYVAMGFDGALQPIGDFWFFDLATRQWTELALPTGMSPRAFTAWLPAGAGALGTMLSGYDGAGPIREVWELAM